MESETKQCQNCKKDFIIEPDDFAFYEKIKVPAPTWCPECRLTRRLAFRNERSIYKRKCDLCGNEIISVFHKNFQQKVYCQSCWWSDKWDASEYAMDYDSNTSFLEQFSKLFKKIPIMSLWGLHLAAENSDYVNMYSYVKDCYLCTYIDYSEKCLYSSFVLRSKDSIDCLMLQNSELCYESVNCHKCYRAAYSLDCENCQDIKYSRNCRGCSNCYGCVNLVSKNCYIFNQPYEKEQYEEEIKKIEKENPRKLWNNFPQKYIHGRHNTDVSGEYVYNSKNTKDSYLSWNMENCRFSSFADGLKDSYDFTNYGDRSELFYEALQCGDQCSKLRFCWWACGADHDIDYSAFIIGSGNLFGCVGLKKRNYCILNKQYTKEEYEALKNQIIKNMEKSGEWGEFFPLAMSPFSYNETTAQEFFPLTKEQAVEQGYKWKDPEERSYKITLKPSDLPDGIKEVPDSITSEIIECEHEGKCNEQCTTAFKIIKEELQFYRKMNLPLPRLCPNCRHYERLKQRNPIKLWHRQCMCDKINHGHEGKCQNEFETSYAPERPEIVYCEQCYNQEVV